MTESAGARRLLVVAANPSIDRQYELDALVAGRIHRPVSVVAVAGGKGLNAARAAVQLGGRVTAVGIVGGRAGDWIADELAMAGVDARLVRTTAETRTCVTILDRATGDTTEVYEHGAALDASSWGALEAAIADELGRGDVATVTLSGSLSPGAPPDGFGRIAAIARGAGGAGVPVLADTYGAALAAVLVERPALVKVNAEEAADATGLAVVDPTSARVAAEQLRASGAGSVVVTLGVQGAIVVTANGATRLIPADRRGDYPVGSGDAVLAGIAVGLARGEELIGATRLGLAAGLANALCAGAGRLDLDGIAEALDEVRVAAL